MRVDFPAPFLPNSARTSPFEREVNVIQRNDSGITLISCHHFCYRDCLCCREHRDLCESAIRADHQRALPATVYRLPFWYRDRLAPESLFTVSLFIDNLQCLRKTALPIFLPEISTTAFSTGCFPAPEQFQWSYQNRKQQFFRPDFDYVPLLPRRVSLRPIPHNGVEIRRGDNQFSPTEIALSKTVPS